MGDDEIVRFGLVEGGRVLDLCLDAGKGNVLDAKLMTLLHDALVEYGQAPSLRLILLRSASRHFSYGASIEEHQADQAPETLATFHRLIRAVGCSEVPVATVLSGQCLGGAFEIALASHFVLAAPGTVMSCPEIKLGVFPPVLAAIGSQRIGSALTEQLLLTGGSLDLQAGLARGFVTKVLDGEHSLLDQALAWYQEQLAPLSGYVLRQAVKAAREASGLYRALGEGLELAEQAYLQHIVPSHDGNEGIAAFLERRRPVWLDT